VRRAAQLTLFLAAAQVLPAAAFDPLKDVPVVLAGGVLSVTLPEGVHLKVRSFKVALISRGALTCAALPPTRETDDAGDPILRGTVRVRLSGRALEDPARLRVTYQPCTEGPDGVCFLPVNRALTAPAGEISEEP
jgi:hypothetical protein